jgi:hypothetical protein
MLSFNHLGNFGRIGNQMFQYSAIKGISKLKNFEFCIPPKENFGIYHEDVKNSDCSIYDCFDFDSLSQKIIPENADLWESFFLNYDEKLIKDVNENSNLLGYFQTEKYFKHIEKELR